MNLFIQATDSIMHEVAVQFNGNAVAYADDLLIGISNTDDEQEVIRIIAEKFSHIGLELNLGKCICTKNANVKFMGVYFSQNKNEMITLAPQLVKKCENELKVLQQMKDKKVPKSMIYKFLIRLVLPSLSYGCFIDETEAHEDYNTIDNQLAEFFEVLFKSNLPIQQLITNMSEPLENGGQQLLMPGREFDTMQLVKNAPTIDEGVAIYHKTREENFIERRKEYIAEQVKLGRKQQNFANFGFTNYKSLTDE